jgi:hypothetical protein
MDGDRLRSNFERRKLRRIDQLFDVLENFQKPRLLNRGRREQVREMVLGQQMVLRDVPRHPVGAI